MTNDNGTTAGAVADAEVTTEVNPEVQPGGDAGEQVIADAASTAEVTPDASLEAETAEYLKSIDDKESETRAPESTRRTGPDPRQVDAALATFRTNHDTRQKAIDALEADLVDAGMAESVARRFVKEAKDKLNEHHADSLKYAGFEATQQVLMGHHNAIEDALKVLPEEELADFTARREKAWEENDGVMPYSDMLTAIREISHESGRKAGYKDGAKQGYLDGRRKGEQSLGSAQSGSEVNGGGPGRNEDELLLDPNTPIETINKILARRNGE